MPKPTRSTKTVRKMATSGLRRFITNSDLVERQAAAARFVRDHDCLPNIVAFASLGKSVAKADGAARTWRAFYSTRLYRDLRKGARARLFRRVSTRGGPDAHPLCGRICL